MPKFKSEFEKLVYQTAHRKGWKYETEKFKYTSEHEYTPDFSRDGFKVRLEAKGRFRDSAEAAKYLDIRKANPNIEIVFVFMNPNTPMPMAKKRKDGTKYSMKEWAEKNGFQWCTISNLKEFIE